METSRGWSKVSNGRTLVLEGGALVEPTQDAQRTVLWVPGSRDGTYQHWERIATVPRAETAVEQGLCAIPATALPARQRVQGFFGKLWRRSYPATADRTWLLPNGEAVEQAGERQTDLLLVWPEDETTRLDATRIKSRWPQCQRCQQLGKNLFVISGVETPGANIAAEPPPPQGEPREVAEHLLAAARRTGDRRREVSALTDLGLVALRAGEVQRALALYEDALALARQLG